MSIGTTVIGLAVHLQQEEVEHGQNVKIHFSITLDISGIFRCTPLFQHALSCKNATSQIHVKLNVNTDISLCIGE